MRRAKATVMLVLAAVSVGGAWAANYEALNVAGCFKLPVKGNRTQLMSVPLTKMPVYRGVLSGNTTTSVTDSSASWTAGQYAWGVSGQETAGASYFYAEVTQSNSVHIGLHGYITNNTTTSLIIKGGLGTNIAANALAGCAYKIVPAYRIRDIFGEPGYPRLAGGSSATDTNADTVTIWDPASGYSGAWAAPIHYHTSGAPTNLIGHWVKDNLNADSHLMDRDDGFLLKRRNAAATNLVVTGTVSPNVQTVEGWCGESMVVGGMTVVNVMFKDSGLTNAPGFLAKGHPSGYTTIYEWNPEAGSGMGNWDTPIFFQSNHWYKGTVNADTNYLRAGNAYGTINPGGLHWERPSPLPQGVAP